MKWNDLAVPFLVNKKTSLFDGHHKFFSSIPETGVASHCHFNLPTTQNDCCVCAVRHLMTLFPICKLPER